MSDEDITSFEGPVERLGENLVLRIPSVAGVIECSRGISEIQGEFLVITIPEWLSGMLRIDEGSRVYVNNRDGKCNIQPVNFRPLQ